MINNTKRIQDAACAAFRIPKDKLLGPSRKFDVVLPRHLAMYLCRKYTSLSFPQLGMKFCRDHTSIIHGCRNAEELLQVPAYALICKSIEDVLGLKMEASASTEGAMREAWKAQAVNTTLACGGEMAGAKAEERA